MFWRAIVPVVLLSLCIGCEPGESSQANSPARTPSSSASPKSLNYAGVVAAIPEADARAIAADSRTGDDVKRIVADSRITFDEYEGAVLAGIACARAAGAGFRPDDPRLSVRGVYTWSAKIPGVPGASDVIAQVEDCRDKNLGIVELYWKQAVAPTEVETRGAMGALAECMKQGGIEGWVPDGLVPADFQALPSRMPPSDRLVYVQCARVVQDAWGLIGFVGEAP